MLGFNYTNLKKETLFVEKGTLVTYFIGSDSYSGEVLTIYKGGVIVKTEVGTVFIKERQSGWWTELDSQSGYYDFGYAESYQSPEF